jgi:GNAT superfamily N-acetyltransferase
MYELVKATERDVSRVVEFFDKRRHTHNMFIPRGWVRVHVLGSKKNRPQIVLMAIHNDEVVAVAIMTNRGMLWRILVDKNHRGKQLGKIMVEQLSPCEIRASKQSEEYWKKLGYYYTISGGKNGR